MERTGFPSLANAVASRTRDCGTRSTSSPLVFEEWAGRFACGLLGRMRALVGPSFPCTRVEIRRLNVLKLRGATHRWLAGARAANSAQSTAAVSLRRTTMRSADEDY